MIGYHGTTDTNIEKRIESILTNGFESKYRKDHWLGQGIYFFEDEFWASQWCNQNISKEKCILKSEINYTEDKFWDLNVQKFRKKCENEIKKLITLLEKKKKILSSNPNVQRCYYLDIIKRTNKLEVIKCIFELKKDPSPIMSMLEVINTQVQICVTKNENIENTHVHKKCRCGERMK